MNFFSGHDDVIQNSIDPHPLMTLSPKYSNKTCPDFVKLKLGDFLLSRGFEQLSNSIGWRVMAGNIQADISASAVFNGF